VASCTSSREVSAPIPGLAGMVTAVTCFTWLGGSGSSVRGKFTISARAAMAPLAGAMSML